MIKAKHTTTGRTATFSKRAWELLPTHKDGWEKVVAPSHEVQKHIQTHSPEAETPPAKHAENEDTISKYRQRTHGNKGAVGKNR